MVFHINYICGAYMIQIQVLHIRGIPDIGVEMLAFMECFSTTPFLLLYDHEQQKSYIKILDTDQKSSQIQSILAQTISGMSLEPVQVSLSENIQAFSFYKSIGREQNFISNMIRIQKTCKSALLFIPQPHDTISEFKNNISQKISEHSTKSSSSYTKGFVFKETQTLHNDIFQNSEERKLLLSIINDIDQSVMSGHACYKIFLILDGVSQENIKKISEISNIFSGYKIHLSNISDLLELNKKSVFIYGSSYVSCLPEFIGPNTLNYPIKTFMPKTSGDIIIGDYLNNGSARTNHRISIQKSALNLGFIISGLPGMGKSSAAMQIVNQICKLNNKNQEIKIAILSTSEEWNSLGNQNSMNIIRLGSDNKIINFFKSTDKPHSEKFFQNLAMLIAAASNSGPYKNPIEKCLLNAFNLHLNEETKTNPSYLYNRIEDSIILMHGKETNVGVKYTKHGENIRASLESLRVILSHPEYSNNNAPGSSTFLNKGVIFDTSFLSTEIRAYMYALILNQIYAVADLFDVDGDNQLRMLICIEEAQTLFGNSTKGENAATADLINRIQDFRKKGVGLMLITHSVTDIDPRIRRLCQNKLYFKQPADISTIVSKELVFTYSSTEIVANKLKHLNSNIAVFDFVSKENDEKISNDSLFVSTVPYNNKILHTQHHTRKAQLYQVINIEINDIREKPQKEFKHIQIRYLGNTIAQMPFKNIITPNLLEGRFYIMEILSEARRTLFKIEFECSKRIIMEVDNNSINIIKRE